MNKTSIRKQLLLAMMGLIFILLLLITAFEIESDKMFFQKELDRRIELIRKSMDQQGLTLSHNVSVYTENAIASYNFFNISQTMEELVKEHESLVYGLLVDISGIVHVHTKNKKLVETRLSSKIDKFALAQTEFSSQEYEKDGVSFLEFVTPLKIGDKPWGFLRLGFSLEEINAEIQDASLSMEQHLRQGLWEIAGVIVFCLIVGILLIVGIAERIALPLTSLTEFSNQLAKGNFNAEIPNNTQNANEEIGTLSKAFTNMAKNIQISRNKLEAHSHHLEQEVTIRKTAEKALNQKTMLIELLQEIAVTANEASTIEEAMKVCLKKICLYTGWPVGHVYETDSKRERLNPTKIWHFSSSSLEFETFREVTDSASFDTGIGLPGRILKSGKPLWIEDVTKVPWFTRTKSAKNVGVRSGFGFPVLERRKVVAVLEFFSDKTAKPDRYLLLALSNLAVQLGRVTERKRSEDALKESHEQLHGILDNSTAVIYLKDLSGRYLFINKRFEDLFKVEKEKIIGQKDKSIFPLKMAEAFMHNDKKVREKGSPIEFEEYAPHEDGIHTYISIKFPLFDSAGKNYAICGISTDISERKKAETTLKEFSKKLVDTQEQERKRIAAEFHDSMGLNLVVIKNQIESHLKTISKDGKGAEGKELVASVKIVNQTISEMREIASNLRPPQLDKLGLKKALLYQVRKTFENSDINVTSKIDLNGFKIPSEIEINLFRIVQEGCNNILKHSSSSEAIINLTKADKNIYLEISDNGKGIEKREKKRKITGPERYGLIGIAERAKMFDGSFQVNSKKGLGTTLIIKVPISEK